MNRWVRGRQWTLVKVYMCESRFRNHPVTVTHWSESQCVLYASAQDAVGCCISFWYTGLCFGLPAESAAQVFISFIFLSKSSLCVSAVFLPCRVGWRVGGWNSAAWARLQTGSYIINIIHFHSGPSSDFHQSPFELLSLSHPWWPERQLQGSGLGLEHCALFLTAFRSFYSKGSLYSTALCDGKRLKKASPVH